LELLRSENRALGISDTDDLPTIYTSTRPPTGVTCVCDAFGIRNRSYKKWIKWMQGAGVEGYFVFFKHEDEGTGPKLAAQFIKQLSHTFSVFLVSLW
jgi:hypothetical protein